MTIYYLVLCFSFQYNQFLQVDKFNTEKEANKSIIYEQRECYVERITKL